MKKKVWYTFSAVSVLLIVILLLVGCDNKGGQKETVIISPVTRQASVQSVYLEGTEEGIAKRAMGICNLPSEIEYESQFFVEQDSRVNIHDWNVSQKRNVYTYTVVFRMDRIIAGHGWGTWLNQPKISGESSSWQWRWRGWEQPLINQATQLATLEKLTNQFAGTNIAAITEVNKVDGQWQTKTTCITLLKGED